MIRTDRGPSSRSNGTSMRRSAYGGPQGRVRIGFASLNRLQKMMYCELVEIAVSLAFAGL